MDLSFLIKAVGVVFRESLEAVLIYGIITSFFRRMPGQHAKELRAGRIGLVLGIIASLFLGAAFVGLTNFISEEFFAGLEVYVVFGGSLLMLYMVFWMSEHARTQKKEIETGLSGALQTSGIWSLIGVVFIAVFREGMETVVYIYSLTLADNEISHRSMVLLSLVLGIGLALVVYQAIQMGSKWLSVQKVFMVTGIWLLLSASSLLATGFDKMASQGTLSSMTEPLFSVSMENNLITRFVQITEGITGLRLQPSSLQIAGFLVFWIFVFVKDPLRLRSKSKAPTKIHKT